MYLPKIPKLLHAFYPDYRWRFDTDEKVVYLTFDDGPTPEITDWVLGQLAEYGAKATFFLIGKNVETYPLIAHRVIDSGHAIGNHTYSHRNGWRTDIRTYLKDFLKGQQAIREYTGLEATLFRPPYGKLTAAQARRIMPTHEVVMMDVMAGDFDPDIDGETALHNALDNISPGAIVVLHDSVKAWERLQYALPRLLEALALDGYRFEALPS